MFPIWEVLGGILVLSFSAGVLGALLGLGGGIIIVPGLVLLFGVDIHLAIAASLISIVANSAGSASRYAREGLLNLRLGFFLEVATATGGVIGALLATTLLSGPTGTTLLLIAFVPITLSAALLMNRTVGKRVEQVGMGDPLSDRWRLDGDYRDDFTGETRRYRVAQPRRGLLLSLAAGAVSGLLGVGGGLFKVPAMNAIMRVPIKVASATSSLMIGVTAGAGALVFLIRGDVAPLLATPVTLGALVGSYAGTFAHDFASRDALKIFLIVILVAAALLIALRALGVLPVA